MENRGAELEKLYGDCESMRTAMTDGSTSLREMLEGTTTQLTEERLARANAESKLVSSAEQVFPAALAVLMSLPRVHFGSCVSFVPLWLC